MLSPQGVLVEQYDGDPLEWALDAARGLDSNQVLVSELVELIDDAAADARVTAIHLELDGFQGGSLDKLERVAAAMERFRETGKPVLASGAGIEQASFYLGAHADELYLDPAGGLFFIGATMDRQIRAFDVHDGETLWKYTLPVDATATPMTYQYRGRQYVVINAGGHHMFQRGYGDYLYAFALPD